MTQIGAGGEEGLALAILIPEGKIVTKVKVVTTLIKTVSRMSHFAEVNFCMMSLSFLRAFPRTPRTRKTAPVCLPLGRRKSLASAVPLNASLAAFAMQ